MTAKKQSLLDKGVIINVRLSGLLRTAFPFAPGLAASASVGAAMVLPGTEQGGRGRDPPPPLSFSLVLRKQPTPTHAEAFLQRTGAGWGGGSQGG